MGAILLLVAVLLPVFVGVVFTRGQRTFRFFWEAESFVRPGADSAMSYRGHAPGLVETEIATGDLAVSELPDVVRVTATFCRVAFCVALISVLPVFFVLFFAPQIGIGLGLTGLALAAGQAGARGGLLSGTAHGASRAFAVGIWTIVHQVFVVGVVVYATLATDDWWVLNEGVRMFAMNDAGFVVVAYALASAALGVALLVASRRLVAWRAERHAV